MLEDAISEYETVFKKQVGNEIVIEISADGVSAASSSNTSYFTTWLR